MGAGGAGITAPVNMGSNTGHVSALGALHLQLGLRDLVLHFALAIALRRRTEARCMKLSHGPACPQMGLGHEAPSELAESDDAFDQYRKRMMLAYRFRPNPGNNPRRSYDGYATL